MKAASEHSAVGVVGLGYVGLPLALSFEQAGHEVIGVDLDRSKVDRLLEGRTTIDDVSTTELKAALDGGFEPTVDYERLRDVDAVVVTVPTPLSGGDPDPGFVRDAATTVAEVVAPGTLVVLESTVYPGGTEEILVRALAEHGFEPGEDVFVAYSPERISPGSGRTVSKIPKVVGGFTDECTETAAALYGDVFEEVVPVSSPRVAEFSKMIENTFRAVNISFVNELAKIAHHLDVDVWESIDAAATKPFGFMPFYPGPGFGGHCIPVDPVYLTRQAAVNGAQTPLIDAAMQINDRMPSYVVFRVKASLDDRGIDLADANVLVLGITYKPDVADARQSPSVELFELIDERAGRAEFHDPFVPEVTVAGESRESAPLEVEDYDCVLVGTDHSTFDLDRIVEAAPLVFDTRNAVDRDASNVVRL